MKKEVKVVFSPEAEEVYKYLNGLVHQEEEKRILNAIHKKIELIKANYHYGEPISKNKIPRQYIKKYDIANLFWIELPHFWRMLYSLRSGKTEIEIVAFVVDIADHRKYGKLFCYKKH